MRHRFLQGRIPAPFRSKPSSGSIVNLKEAREQNVKLPQTVPLRADEFIE
jgi:hypothetical protein